MPSKNVVKKYVEGGFYHVYNRGVERRRIFLDDQDYRVFLGLQKYYLSKPQEQETQAHPLSEVAGFEPVRARPLQSLYQKVELHTYCLMPNHFHLLLKQIEKNGMESLLRRTLTTYAMYFNRRYDRVGHLFQGPYKAAIVENDNYLLHLSRYIHSDPTLTKKHLNQYPYSSYQNFLGEKNSEWLDTEFILSFFEKANKKSPDTASYSNYKEFLELSEEEPKDVIGSLVIESD